MAVIQHWLRQKLRPACEGVSRAGVRLAVSLTLLSAMSGSAWASDPIPHPEFDWDLPQTESATHVVDSFLDEPDGDLADDVCSTSSGDCTLRAAIEQANARDQGDTVLLPASGGVYTLTLGSSLVVTTPLTIRTAQPAAATIIDGNGNGPVLDVSAPAVTVSGVMIRNGQGGVVNQDASQLTLINSTIADNTISGLLNGNGTLTLINSTVSGNSGGGITNLVTGTVNLVNTTIVSNTAVAGGGVSNTDGGTVVTRGSLIAGNSSSPLQPSPDCAGPIVSQGYNLLGNNTGCNFIPSGATDQVGTGASPLNPGLGPLRDNGGPSFTHALSEGSPAIDQGDPDGCRDQQGLPLETDQRGVARPQGVECDIGAFELPVVRFTSATFKEFETAGQATVKVALDENVPFPVTVSYSTTNGTALDGVHYLAVTGTLTLTSGSQQATFTVPVLHRQRFDTDYSLHLHLAGPNGAAIGPPPPPVRAPLGGDTQATLIVRNAEPPPTVQFITSTFSIVRAGPQPLIPTVVTTTLNTASDITATVVYSTTGGTAQPGADYVPVTGALVFPPGVLTATFPVTLTNPFAFQGDETIGLILNGPPVSATLGAPTNALINIIDKNPRVLFMPFVTRDFLFCFKGPSESEPNDTPPQANGTLCPDRLFTGTNRGVDDRDYYYFYRRTTGPITVNVLNLALGAQVQVFYQTVSVNTRIGFAGAPPFEIQLNNQPSGTYYVLVFTPLGYSGGPYTLQVLAP
jgi:CSLREA domain-containing protein